MTCQGPFIDLYLGAHGKRDPIISRETLVLSQNHRIKLKNSNLLPINEGHTIGTWLLSYSHLIDYMKMK